MFCCISVEGHVIMGFVVFMCIIFTANSNRRYRCSNHYIYSEKHTKKKHKESISFPQSTNGELTKRDCLLTSASKMTSFCCVSFLFVGFFFVCFCGIHLHTTLTPLERENKCLMMPWCSLEGGPGVSLQSGSYNPGSCQFHTLGFFIENQPNLEEKKIPSNAFRIQLSTSVYSMKPSRVLPSYYEYFHSYRP